MALSNDEIVERIAMYLAPELFDTDNPDMQRPGPRADREKMRDIGRKLLPLIRELMEEE